MPQGAVDDKSSMEAIVLLISHPHVHCVYRLPLRCVALTVVRLTLLLIRAGAHSRFPHESPCMQRRIC